MLLVPGDPLNPRRVDPHFAAQAVAARESGTTVARIDHDALGRPAEAVAGVPAGDDAVYRGWMMTATEYDGFAKALGARRVTLRTSGDEYRAAHELPGWYEALKPSTRSRPGPRGRIWPGWMPSASGSVAGPQYCVIM